MTKDHCSEVIASLSDSIALEFREYDGVYRSNPLMRWRHARRMLAKALEGYQLIFAQWQDFYSSIDKRFKPAYQDRASSAIQGLPNKDLDPLTACLLDLERRYKELCEPSAALDVKAQAQRISLAFDIARDQVAELALAYTKTFSDIAAAKTNADSYTESLKIAGPLQPFQAYLQQTFPKTWVQLSDGRPTFDIAREIIEQLREGKTPA